MENKLSIPLNILPQLLSRDSEVQRKNLTYTAADAVNSNLPSLLTVMKEHANLPGEIFELIAKFIEVYYPGTNISLVGAEFVNILLQTRFTWNLIDVQAFINFSKTNRPPHASGHKITPTDLIESVELYEIKRAEETEKKIAARKIAYEKEILSKDQILKSYREIKAEQTVAQKKEKDLNDKITENKQRQDKAEKRIELVKSLKDKIANREILESEALVMVMNFDKNTLPGA